MHALLTPRRALRARLRIARRWIALGAHAFTGQRPARGRLAVLLVAWVLRPWLPADQLAARWRALQDGRAQGAPTAIRRRRG